MNKEKVKKKDVKISACMVLKNEGTTIYRCLESLIGLVDEWIIGIDDTCSDNTEKEVVKFFYDKGMGTHKDKIHIINSDGKNIGELYNFKWNKSFCDVRNEGIEKATGDYILIMDGHEYFPDEWFNITVGETVKVRSLFPKIKSFLSDNRVDQGYIQLYQQPFIGTVPNNFFLQPRLYRNGFYREYEKGEKGTDHTKYVEDKKRPIKLNRDVHNTIINTHPDSSIHFDEIILIHDAPPLNRVERKEQRLEMNIPDLLKKIKENKKDFRSYFYLGNTYMEAKQWRKAIKAFDFYLKNMKGDHTEKYQVLVHKSLCHRDLKEWSDMRDCLGLCIAMDQFRRDAYMIMGDMFIKLNDYDKAIYYYSLALNIKPTASRMFQNGAANTWDCHQKIAFAYANKGVLHKAIVHLSHANRFYTNEKWTEQIKLWQDGKPNVLIVDRGGSFTGDFIKHLKDSRKYNVIDSKQADTRLGMWADYIWSEWGNDDAYLFSKKFPKKTVIRVHGWEAYGLPKLWKQIAWNNCKKVIFVCEHIRKKMIEQCCMKHEKTQVIYNGVDTDKFFIKEDERNSKNIGYAGYLNVKKNPFLLMQIIKANPDYNFHLRVNWQDPYLKASFDYEMKDCKNIIIHDWYNDLNDFWNQMSGVLSTSITESFSYNVAEGMASGCKPYIYNWEGASDLYNKEWIFDKMPKFEDVTLAQRKEYRKFIIDTYPLQKSLDAMEKVLVGDE